MGVVLDVTGGKVSVLAGFEHPGVLALEPTLTERALALPLVSSGPTSVDNAVLGTDALFAGAYDAKPSPKRAKARASPSQ